MGYNGCKVSLQSWCIEVYTEILKSHTMQTSDISVACGRVPDL